MHMFAVQMGWLEFLIKWEKMKRAWDDIKKFALTTWLNEYFWFYVKWSTKTYIAYFFEIRFSKIYFDLTEIFILSGILYGPLWDTQFSLFDPFAPYASGSTMGGGGKFQNALIVLKMMPFCSTPHKLLKNI